MQHIEVPHFRLSLHLHCCGSSSFHWTGPFIRPAEAVAFGNRWWGVPTLVHLPPLLLLLHPLFGLEREEGAVRKRTKCRGECCARTLGSGKSRGWHITMQGGAVFGVLSHVSGDLGPDLTSHSLGWKGKSGTEQRGEENGGHQCQ